jgi:hypothetical protein
MITGDEEKIAVCLPSLEQLTAEIPDAVEGSNLTGFSYTKFNERNSGDAYEGASIT